MRTVAALTGVLVALLAVFTIVLPNADRYAPGVDDGPPQRFSTIAEAERAAGFDFPDAGTPPGWKVETVIVTPVYYGRRLLNERPELSARRMPIRDAVTSGRAATGVLYFWLSDALPEPPPGVHDYVTIAYASDNGVVIALDFNQPRSGDESIAPMSDVTSTTKRAVHIGGMPATLTTYTSESSEAMTAAWRVNRTRIRATAFNGTPNPRYRITADEFLAFLANVR